MEPPSTFLQQLRKGAWTAEEDSLLRQCIDKYGAGKWHQVPCRAGLNRCRKSCRLRWLNYLEPNIKRGKFGSDEVDLLIRLHKLLGNRWSLIAGRLPGRTANDVKNYWNSHLSKRDTTCSAITPVQNPNVLKPQPRSFFNNNDCKGLNDQPQVEAGEGSNKDDDNYDFVNSLMDGESLWWESLVEKSHEPDAVGGAMATTSEDSSSLINSMSSTFDVEQLWSMFDT